jgi:UDP-3-O-acyl-N-acetylglucosamine deacetylase
LNDDGVVNTTLRFPDEFVRHKVLDLIGDVYLLNRPILGKITAKQTGHFEDIALVKELKKRFL